MHTLGRLLVHPRGAWAVVVAVAILALVSAGLAGQVRQEDDIVAFLPQTNPEVAMFREINESFGGLDVAIVGVETGGPMGAFEGDFLTRLEAATRELKELPGLNQVLSLANVQDFAPDPMGGIRTALLVESPPADAAASAALAERALSRDHIRGALVSEDGSSVVILAFAAFEADPREVASLVRGVAERHFPGESLYWGGAPFVSTYIYDTTQADVARLTPFAVLAIVIIMFLAFRDPIGATLGLASTGVGILISRASMAALDVPLNIVLGSMPIILFAVGSAYGIHVLSRYYSYARVMSCEDAICEMLAETGPTVIIAGLTTAAGLLSFLLMDIEPLRIFGVFTAVGILATLALSLTFIPAVIRIFRIKGRDMGGGPLARLQIRMAVAVRRLRAPVGVALVILAAAGVFFTGKVDSRMDQAAFYNHGSPPQRADAFLAERFGGSTYVQILARGDMADPSVLREIQRMGDAVSRVEGVAGVQHLGLPLGLLNEVMEGARRMPDAPEKVGLIYGLLTGDPSVRQLVTDERDQALVQVKLTGGGDIDSVEATLAAIEAWVADESLTRFRVVEAAAGGDDGEAVAARRRDLAAHRALAVAHQFGVPADEARLRAALGAPAARPDPARIARRVATWLTSAEAMVRLEPEDARAVASAAVPAFDADPDADLLPVIAEALERDEDDADAGDLAWSIVTPLEEAARAQAEAVMAAAGIEAPNTPAGARMEAAFAAAMMELSLDRAAVADASAAPSLELVVNGLPVMHRGLSRSVSANQTRSMLSALALVAVILSIAFRSVSAGLMATAPTALALAVIYGGMGLMGVHLDIGTSMLASIVIGAGVDYAVHMQSNWYAAEGEDLERAAARSAARTGTAIWTNALMVAAGFFVLTLGEARPLQNVGALTAAAMLVAAVTSTLTLPTLARRRVYSARAPAEDPADPAFA